MAYPREPDLEASNFKEAAVGEELERLIFSHGDEEDAASVIERKPNWLIYEAGLLLFLVLLGLTVLFEYRHIGPLIFPSQESGTLPTSSPAGSDLALSQEPPSLPYYPPPVLPRRKYVFRVDAYGAIGDGVMMNTVAFCDVMAAAAAVADKGGGTVYVSAGRWLTGPFSVASNTTLFVGEKAVILASTRREDYSFLPEYPSYCPRNATPMFRAFISGLHLSGVVITGPGTIDGQGVDWWAQRRANMSAPRPPRLIELEGCQGIIISGLTLQNSPHWTVHPIYSQNVHIHGVTILAPRKSKNTDGVNPDSCENVLIENSTISSGDDSIAIKSGRDDLGLALARPSRNITLRSLTIGPFTHGISIGSEVSGGVSGVNAYDINVLGGVQALRIKTMAGRGASVSEVRFRNIWVNAVKRGLQITSMYNSLSDAHPCGGTYNASELTDVRNISIEQFACTNCKHGVEIQGFEARPFHVQLSDVVLVDSEQPWECKDVVGVATNVSPEPCPELRP